MEYKRLICGVGRLSRVGARRVCLRKIKEPVTEVKESLSRRWMAERVSMSWYRMAEEVFVGWLEKLRDSLEEEDLTVVEVSIDID